MKQIIWSNDSYFDDKAREYYQDCQREYLEDDGYTVSYEEWGEEVYSWLDDERRNLNVQVDGVIIAFGDLGLWRPQAGLPDFGQQPCRHFAQLMR